MKLRFIGSVLLAACAVHGQPKLQFEVASVKPAPPPESGHFSWSIHPTPGRYTASNVALKDLLIAAFGIRANQIQCPSWMESERFDVSATEPEGTSKEQVKVMLQNLLIERFKIELRREQREMPVYTLTVVKNGHKMKDAEVDPNPTPPAMMDGAGIGALRGGPPPKDKDGFPMPGRGSWSSSSNEGVTKLTATAMSMSDMTTMLTRQLGNQVVDKTGLAGKYAFRMEYSNDGMNSMVPLPPGARRSETASDPAGPTIFRALQDQLGLKLEMGKAAADFIVIEKAEKTPIEN